ncbi:MAG TPA: hypothetical protein VK530_11215 [Candidatus Acidoferrum sp.]|nr:hypothetical protein [Candidatus Acidoferrum sp.]
MSITSLPNPVARWLLVTLQLALLAVWIPFEVFRRQSLQRIHHHSSVEDICGAVFMTAMLALIVVSPFYFRTHRRVALSGFLLAIAAVAYCVFVPSHR